MNKLITLHTYVEAVLDNTDGVFDKFHSCWFTVPVRWLENYLQEHLFVDANVEEFLRTYTWDDSFDMVDKAAEEGVLEGFGVGDMTNYK